MNKRETHRSLQLWLTVDEMQALQASADRLGRGIQDEGLHAIRRHLAALPHLVVPVMPLNGEAAKPARKGKRGGA